MNWNEKKVVVFGGGGFLGSYIIEELLELGCDQLCSFGRSDQPGLRSKGIRVLQGDIRDEKAVIDACSGADIVFLTAAKAGVWGSWNDYFSINVLGARHVINGCKDNGVGILVYTSSPSVAYSAEVDVENMNERNPYPSKYLAHYPKSKAIAEQDVLAANCRSLKTVSLRPHLIWGPRDPHLIPRVLETAKCGKLKIVGNGENTVDMTYVTNGAHAHVCAAETLSDPERCLNAEGKAYFISDDRPVKLWMWTNDLLKKCALQPVDKKISYRAAHGVGMILELIYSVIPFRGEPPMTRFIAGQFAHSHWFDISAAKKDLGYRIVTDPDKGLENLIKTIYNN